jgi:mevalonate kinase
MNTESTVRRFVEAIHANDAEAIAELMTQNHRFIDSGG